MLRAFHRSSIALLLAIGLPNALAGSDAPTSELTVPIIMRALENRATTRAMHALLGEPHGKFEDGSVEAWRLRMESERLFPATEWENTTHSLVVVFDGTGRVARLALVKIRQ